MLKIILTITVTSLLFMSCGDSANHKQHNQTEASEHNEHERDNERETLQLNKGDKWLVNEEMKPFILEAEEILNQYIKSKSNDYKTLADQLTKKNSGLINSCTMEGESHNELHKWLHPHIELIKSLTNATSEKQASTIIEDLQSSFVTYNQYFQ